MITTLASYRQASADITRSIELVSEQPVVSREAAYYKENIGNIDTIEEFVADTRLFNFAMTAHGLADFAYAKAFMTKVLKEGRDAEDSFANTLTDTRYRDFAETFDFARYGSSATTFTRAQQGTIDRYLRQTLEQQAGEQNQGVRLALYFERKAPTIQSIYEILGDPALGQVVRTAIGLSQATGALDIDKQVELIADRLDLESFSDPDELSTFLERFTTLWEINNPTTAPATGVGLLFTQSPQFGISQDLMMQIAQLKR